MSARFWVAGGTGNWSSTTNWSATTGGASGASVPGSADTATFNASSGAGTATVDSNVTIQTLTMTGFTGTLAFGVNTISVNSTGTVYTGAATFTVTGTPVIIVTNATATATTVTAGAVTEANSISFKFTGGTYALTFLGTASHAAKNVDFTGFGGTWNATAANFIYGSLTLSTGMTLTASTGSMRFAASSGTQIITSNAKTMDFPVAVQGTSSGIVQLADALTLGATRVLSIQTGTLDGNNKTISGASSINISTTSCGAYTVKNISTALAWNTGASSIVTLGGPCTFGVVAMTNSPISLDLVSYQLTCTSFTSGNGTRTLAFGTGNITVNGAGGTLINFTSISTMTITGTPLINVSYSGATAVTITGGGFSEAQSISYNFTTGTYSLTFLNGASETAKNVDFTGFGGTWAAHSGTCTIYGNLTFSSAAGFSAVSGNALTFGATSGTQVITSNGKTHDYSITMNGVGGTVQLADALLMGTTRVFTHTNGTIDLNGKTLTVGTAYTTATGTKVLTFNGGTLVCPAVTTTAFNNAVPTGFSTVAGTGTGKISMTGATAKTFVGGGSTYNCTLSNDGAGALTISGANTFTTIANGSSPTTFTFTSSTTTTVSNLNLNGTSGAITINSTTAGSAATLSKSSGNVYVYNASLRDSTATGGASWYVPGGYGISTNVSNNTGWTFGVTRYLVNGSVGNWSSTAIWSATQGGASGASVPGALDGAVLNCSTLAVIELDTNVTIQTLTSNTSTASVEVRSLSAPPKTLTISGTNTPLKVNSFFDPPGALTFTYDGSVPMAIDTILNSTYFSVDFAFTGGTYALALTNFYCKGLNFTGCAGQVTGDVQSTDGNIVLSSSAGFSFGGGIGIGGSATSNITSSGKTISFLSVAKDSPYTASVTLLDPLTVINQTTLSTGVLNLNNFNLVTGTFAATNPTGSNTKTLAFGTANITCNGSGSAFVVSTNLETTGTPVVNISNNSSVATTVGITGGGTASSEANSISVNITIGTYALSGVSGTVFKNLNFTGFSGSIGDSTTATIYGDLTLSATMTVPSVASAWSVRSTSATPRIITSNAVTFGKPLTFNGVGGTWQLADALTLASSRAVTQTNGTLNLNGKILTVGVYTTAAGTKNLTFNGGELRCPATTTTAFNNAQPTNFTTTAGTGTGYIRMTGATAKTFVGGGSTFNCTLSNDAVGALTISGSNTFTSIANGTQPTTFTFTAGTTQTLTNWNINGTVGNLVTINSSSAGTPASLSKASGTVSADYLSIQDSSATGGASWYAGANSTNVSGNSGWIFTAPPVVTAGGNFFFMF